MERCGNEFSSVFVLGLLAIALLLTVLPGLVS